MSNKGKKFIAVSSGREILYRKELKEGLSRKEAYKEIFREFGFSVATEKTMSGGVYNEEIDTKVVKHDGKPVASHTYSIEYTDDEVMVDFIIERGITYVLGYMVFVGEII